ncbi:MAG: hypothetical protein ACK5LN_00610 [Propioniciclava sp.]
MTIESELIATADQLPDGAQITAAIHRYGHEIVVPHGFDLRNDADGGMLTFQLDGEETVCEYAFTTAADWNASSEVPVPDGLGDSVLSFGAKGPSSIRLVEQLSRAICEHSGAYGWFEQEIVVPPEEMLRPAPDLAEPHTEAVPPPEKGQPPAPADGGTPMISAPMRERRAEEEARMRQSARLGRWAWIIALGLIAVYLIWTFTSGSR